MNIVIRYYKCPRFSKPWRYEMYADGDELHLRSPRFKKRAKCRQFALKFAVPCGPVEEVYGKETLEPLDVAQYDE